MKRSLKSSMVLAVAALAVVTATPPAHAFRMLQNFSTGRQTAGLRVSCSNVNGFAHWTVRDVSWYLNTGNQGGETGTVKALEDAMGAWSSVSEYSLSYVGTTSSGWATDGRNTFVWANDNGCTGGCLALTALVLENGQEIVETDVTFNNGTDWNTDGSDVDVQAVATHELGHTLGIHHTDVSSTPHPTMYVPFFGSAGRSLEFDDRSAIHCSEERYCLQYELTGEGTIFIGQRWGDLSWGDPCIPTSNVDVFRNGTKIATTANDGSYVDRWYSSASSANYWVCEAGSTGWYDADTCTNVLTVFFN